LIIQIKIYKHFHVYKIQGYTPYNLDYKKWTKVRIYYCRACDGPETKYILLKYDYHNKYNKTNI